MRKHILFLLFAFVFCACFEGQTVTQGTVVRYDPQEKVLVVKDERAPFEENAFDVANAEMGSNIDQGDQVRLVWREKDGKKRAWRVMNLTKQKELEKPKK